MRLKEINNQMKIQKYIKSIKKRKADILNTPMSTSKNSVSFQPESSKKSEKSMEPNLKGGASRNGSILRNVLLHLHMDLVSVRVEVKHDTRQKIDV